MQFKIVGASFISAQISYWESHAQKNTQILINGSFTFFPFRSVLFIFFFLFAAVVVMLYSFLNVHWAGFICFCFSFCRFTFIYLCVSLKNFFLFTYPSFRNFQCKKQKKKTKTSEKKNKWNEKKMSAKKIHISHFALNVNWLNGKGKKNAEKEKMMALKLYSFWARFLSFPLTLAYTVYSLCCAVLFSYVHLGFYHPHFGFSLCLWDFLGGNVYI